MKNIYLCSAAVAALFISSSFIAESAHAAAYGKDSDSSILNNAQTYDNTTKETAPAATTPAPAPAAAEPVAPQVEPQAGDEASSLDDFTGPYAGLEAAYNFGHADIDPAIGGEDRLSINGWDGGAFIGYGFTHTMMSDWLGSYLGVELGYDMSNADKTQSGVKFEKDHNWMVTLRPGFNIKNDTLAYGIAGYTRAQYEAAGDDQNFGGYVVGLGSEINTHTAAKIRLEYTYANYTDKDFGGLNFNPSENDVKLGVLFQF